MKSPRSRHIAARSGERHRVVRAGRPGQHERRAAGHAPRQRPVAAWLPLLRHAGVRRRRGLADERDRARTGTAQLPVQQVEIGHAVAVHEIGQAEAVLGQAARRRQVRGEPARDRSCAGSSRSGCQARRSSAAGAVTPIGRGCRRAPLAAPAAGWAADPARSCAVTAREGTRSRPSGPDGTRSRAPRAGRPA